MSGWAPLWSSLLHAAGGSLILLQTSFCTGITGFKPLVVISNYCLYGRHSYLHAFSFTFLDLIWKIDMSLGARSSRLQQNGSGLFCWFSSLGVLFWPDFWIHSSVSWCISFKMLVLVAKQVVGTFMLSPWIIFSWVLSPSSEFIVRAEQLLAGGFVNYP